MKILDGCLHESIEEAAVFLRKGDIVAFPTETVYGLGADAQNPYAVARIFEAKKRPHFDPLIVHLGEKDWLYRVARNIPEQAHKLVERFWPGPLTLILTKEDNIPDIVTAGLSTVAVRMPSHDVALDLIRTFGGPVAAPSANPFGYMSPTKAGHVALGLKDRIPLILDGGNTTHGIESTILSIRNDGVFIHRHGALSEEELSEFVSIIKDGKKDAQCLSPGEMPYHYAPMKPLKLIKNIDEIKKAESSFLAFKEPGQNPISKYMKVLSPTGDLKEAAANFFSFLIELDHDDTEIIYAEKLPEKGIGRAIMERLRKASRKSTSFVDG